MPGFIAQPLRLIAFLLVGATALAALTAAGEHQARQAPSPQRVAMIGMAG